MHRAQARAPTARAHAPVVHRAARRTAACRDRARHGRRLSPRSSNQVRRRASTRGPPGRSGSARVAQRGWYVSGVLSPVPPSVYSGSHGRSRHGRVARRAQARHDRMRLLGARAPGGEHRRRSTRAARAPSSVRTCGGGSCSSPRARERIARRDPHLIDGLGRVEAAAPARPAARTTKNRAENRFGSTDGVIQCDHGTSASVDHARPGQRERRRARARRRGSRLRRCSWLEQLERLGRRASRIALREQHARLPRTARAPPRSARPRPARRAPPGNTYADAMKLEPRCAPHEEHLESAAAVRRSRMTEAASRISALTIAVVPRHSRESRARRAPARRAGRAAPRSRARRTARPGRRESRAAGDPSRPRRRANTPNQVRNRHAGGWRSTTNS